MKKLLYQITTPIILPYWWQDVLLLIPRLYCGYLLTAEFGAPKFGLPWSPAENNLGFFEVAFWFPGDVAEYGGIFKTFSVFLAWMGAFSEGVGGIALIAGFQSRIFAFLVSCTMLVAAYAQHANDGLWSQLPALGFLGVAMYIFILGAGRFSADYLIAKKIKS